MLRIWLGQLVLPLGQVENVVTRPGASGNNVTVLPLAAM